MSKELIPVANVVVYYIIDKSSIIQGETIVKMDDVGVNMVRTIK